MKIQKTLGAGVMSLGLVLGLSSFAGATSGTIRTTGPRSNNVIRDTTTQRVRVNNDNDLHVWNGTHQDAWSGNATVRDNTTGGDATSGDATNDNSFNVNASVDNSGSVEAAVMPVTTDSSNSGGSASISDTGPHSNNVIKSSADTSVSVSNDNDLSVGNYTSQTSTSGNATVRDNTTGGDATSGDATNTNSTSITLSVNN